MSFVVRGVEYIDILDDEMYQVACESYDSFKRSETEDKQGRTRIDMSSCGYYERVFVEKEEEQLSSDVLKSMILKYIGQEKGKILMKSEKEWLEVLKDDRSACLRVKEFVIKDDIERAKDYISEIESDHIIVREVRDKGGKVITTEYIMDLPMEKHLRIKPFKEFVEHAEQYDKQLSKFDQQKTECTK